MENPLTLFQRSMASTYGEIDLDRDDFFPRSRLRDRRHFADPLSPPRLGDRRPLSLIVADTFDPPRPGLGLARRPLPAAVVSFASSAVVDLKSRWSTFLERRPRGPACLRSFRSRISVSLSSSFSSSSSCKKVFKKRRERCLGRVRYNM